jgi:hypothetical protein
MFFFFEIMMVELFFIRLLVIVAKILVCAHLMNSMIKTWVFSDISIQIWSYRFSFYILELITSKFSLHWVFLRRGTIPAN